MQSSVGPAAVTPFIYIGKYVAYPFKVDANIRALKLAFDGLKAMERDMNENNTNRGNEVDEWIKQVNDITKAV